jgi:hypothetical protein
MFHSESAGAGNIAAIARLLEKVAAASGLPPTPPFPDAGTVFELVEAAGFEIPTDGVRTVAQRRPFNRNELIALLRPQASLVIIRHAPNDSAEALVDALTARVDELRRADGSYDQTFVRLEILVHRPSRPRPPNVA